MQVGQTVNAKHENGRFYGAFVSRVNVDGTYQVYFQQELREEFQTRDNKHEEIKMPLQTARQRSFPDWNSYKGKMFYDEGTRLKSGDWEFEPGEFVVDGVIANKCNFLCHHIVNGDEGVEKADEGEEFDIAYVLREIRDYEEE